MVQDIEERYFDRLQSALAAFDAAFPAGDYGLNCRQNLAVNALLELSFDMARDVPSYGARLGAAHEEAASERDRELRENLGG